MLWGSLYTPYFSLNNVRIALFVAALGILYLLGCARQGAPTGGPKDTTPPRVDSSGSTPNFSKRFTGRRIQLKFDEWVVLSDVATQVLVSPPLVTKPVPSVTLKGKTVTVTFPEEEELRPNTTYTINFGTSIKDLHEGNAAKNLRFVFSTGDFIDSLRVTGSVADAFTGLPAENVAVMLYEATEDSVVRKQKPFYFARADKDGQYVLENVRPGRFKMVAIEDLSGNLKWEEGSERIAFRDTLLSVKDSMGGIPRLRLFKVLPKARKPDSDAKRYGVVRLKYGHLPDSLSLRFESPNLVVRQERVLDTLLVWYDQVPEEWPIYAGKDTVRIKTPDRAAFVEKHRLRFADDAPPPSTSRGRRGTPDPSTPPPAAAPIKAVSVLPGKSIPLDFNVPITVFDTTKWNFTFDSLPVRNFTLAFDSILGRRLNLRYPWVSGQYVLTLLPGAITDLYGTTNTDTLRRLINGPNTKLLGSLTLGLGKLKPGTPYVLQLLNGTALEAERRFVANADEQPFNFYNLPTATYTVQVIEDRNGNGRWDTGDYYAHRQPEALFSKKLEPLRPNWELDANFKLE